MSEIKKTWYLVLQVDVEKKTKNRVTKVHLL